MKQNENEFCIEEEFTFLNESNITNNNKNTIFNKKEKPNVIIEKILTNIYSHNIKTEKIKKEEELKIDSYQNEINNLCMNYGNYYIIFLLLKIIPKLINKYHEIIFEIPTINEKAHEKLNLLILKRSNSQSNKIPKI